MIKSCSPTDNVRSRWNKHLHNNSLAVSVICIQRLRLPRCTEVRDVKGGCVRQTADVVWSSEGGSLRAQLFHIPPTAAGSGVGKKLISQTSSNFGLDYSFIPMSLAGGGGNNVLGGGGQVVLGVAIQFDWGIPPLVTQPVTKGKYRFWTTFVEHFQTINSSGKGPRYIPIHFLQLFRKLLYATSLTSSKYVTQQLAAKCMY